MIPKVIHYCWFGRNPLPPLAIKCIESWKKYLPDYEIKEWNEDNFDVNIITYTKEAYYAKRYAFVSDYARFWILYHYGGLYFDTDVEIIKSIETIIKKGAFIGCENNAKSEYNQQGNLGCNPGLGLGCDPGLDFYKEILNLYSTLLFITKDGKQNTKTIVQYTTELLVAHGLKYTNEIQHINGIWIYPKEYFCPIEYLTKKKTITANTCTIHHYAESWVTPWQKFKNIIKRLLRKLQK